MEKPLIDQKFVLKKIPGKGGWTYADLPRVIQNSNTPFGWVKVKGTIDGFLPTLSPLLKNNFAYSPKHIFNGIR